MSLEFDDSAEAILHVTFTGTDQAMTWPIGLDGVYRPFPGASGLTQGMCGDWTDDRSFVIEHDEIAANSHAIYCIRFEDDRTVVEVRRFAHEVGAQFEGTLQEPG